MSQLINYNVYRLYLYWFCLPTYLKHNGDALPKNYPLVVIPFDAM